MVFVESAVFARERQKLLTDEEYRAIQNDMLKRPEKGALIRGGGGLRKLRGRAGSQGKSGGVRVIYYYAARRSAVYLLGLYAKSNRAALDREQIAALRNQLEDVR